jgi:hypothetical protein
MQSEGEGTVVRQGHLIAVVGTFLMAVLVVGCAAGDLGNKDGRGGKRSDVCSEDAHRRLRRYRAHTQDR